MSKTKHFVNNSLGLITETLLMYNMANRHILDLDERPGLELFSFPDPSKGKTSGISRPDLK